MDKRTKLIIAVLFLIIFPVVLVFLAKGVFQGPEAQNKTTLPQETSSHPDSIESEWAKSVISPSGKVSIYVPPKEVRIKGNYLMYFMLKGCSPCARQTKVIEHIYVHHPEIKVEGFGMGFSDKELGEFRFPVRPDTGVSEAYKINTFPSILVFNKNNKRYLLSGYTEKNKILSLFK